MGSGSGQSSDLVLFAPIHFHFSSIEMVKDSLRTSKGIHVGSKDKRKERRPTKSEVGGRTKLIYKCPEDSIKLTG